MWKMHSRYQPPSIKYLKLFLVEIEMAKCVIHATTTNHINGFLVRWCWKEMLYWLSASALFYVCVWHIKFRFIGCVRAWVSGVWVLDMRNGHSNETFRTIGIFFMSQYRNNFVSSQVFIQIKWFLINSFQFERDSVEMTIFSSG